MESNDSFPSMMSQLRQGDPRAAERIFERFTDQLIRFASARMPARLQAKVGADDVVQSVYRSFFRRQAAGEFQFQHAGGLWELLALMTARKCCRWNEHFSAARRDIGQERYAPALESDESAAAWEAPGEDPTPDEVVAVTELVERLMRGLETDTQRRILELRLQGHTLLEIADEVDRSEQTVRRVLRTVQEHLEATLSRE